MDICTGVATTFIQELGRKACKELQYLCKYKIYVQDFKMEQNELSATVESVELKIKEAQKRNKTLVDPIVEHWLESANKLLQHQDTTKPTKFFGLCVNCFSQIAQARDLESLSKEIQTLIDKVGKFPEVAHEAGVPGMEFYSQEFMSFESRKAKFEKLKKEVEAENNNIVGLHGMGGTGKSTMAIEVGKQIEKSNSFDRVMFISVSTPVDEKMIRDDIAKQLGLQLEEEKSLTHAQQIWNKIACAGKVLIILDDVWEKLDLKNMGIQPGFHRNGHCTILLTSRYVNVCTLMECQKMIKLEDLDENDALNLFLFHVCQDCPDDLKKVAVDIVNECGRLPVIVVAMAKSLKDWPRKDWQRALIALKGADKPSRHGIVDENAMKFYNSLKLSYTYLNDKQAQVLFLLCSVFPKTYEIPIELLSRIAIGLGQFGGADKYDTARSQVYVKKNKLLNSSLLLKVGEECVKMHDLIREVAMEIANEEIQVIMDSGTNLKENIKYSSWVTNVFPNCFDDSKLEVLLVWINTNGSLEVPNSVFGSMKCLRVLFLHSKIEFGRTSALSLPKSIQSLKHIRTLSLINWELGDISVLMRNLSKLESLELTNCSISELPKGIGELDKLRYLGLIRCSLGNNNPFEVIARCSKLQELHYVSNDDHIPIGAKVITTLPNYKIYYIDGSDFYAFGSSQLDASIKKCFKPTKKLQRIFSKEIIKSLAARAEILELEGDDETGWNNLIPDIVSIEDGAMKDLIKLSLNDWHEMKCLIYTENLQIKSGETIFSKLVELQLVEVAVTKICCGHYPHGFLNQLEKLGLKSCEELEGTLFKGKIELGNLKSIEIEDCSMTCLFHPSTAQSLNQLETLKIAECSKLKYIIRDEGSSVEEKVDDKDYNPRIHDLMFPKLKLLSVRSCDEFEFMFPICYCEDLPKLESMEICGCENLRYVFGQYPEEGGLHQMQKVKTLCSLKVMSILEVPSFVNIYPDCYLPQKLAANTSEGSKAKDKSSPSHNVSWDPLCCFIPKSKTTNEEEPSTSKVAVSDHATPQDKYVGDRAHGIFTPPLYPGNLRELNIGHISNLKSLFSVFIASSMSLLERLKMINCDELEQIVIEEVNDDDHHHMNANPTFPNLRTIEIEECDKLECVFPVSCSRNLEHLESLHIIDATQLKYVFAKSYGDDNSPHPNQNIEIYLPALNKLSLKKLPDMVSMCPENYYVKASSLEVVILDACPRLPINSLIDVSVEKHQGNEQLSRKKLIGMRLRNFKYLSLASLEVETIYDLERLQIASSENSSLKTLILENLYGLRNICVGPKNLHLNFQNLSELAIKRCNQLKFILPVSISRSLPCLRHLKVLDCEELQRIIEEDDDDDDECCFPKLYRIIVENCKRLNCLFSISTCGSLPQLSVLYISSAPELEQVFGGKQGATHELHINYVFPKLFVMHLEDLPKLHTICPVLDFQAVIYRVVQDCPNISLTSTNNEPLNRYMRWFGESEKNKGNMDYHDLYERRINRAREVAKKLLKSDRPAAEENNGSSNIEEITGASDEDRPKPEEATKANEFKDSGQTSKPAPFSAPSQIESPQQTIKETKKRTSQEGSKLDEALKTNQIMSPESIKPTPIEFVVPSENEHPRDHMDHIEGEGERSTFDQQPLSKTEPDMHLDASQKNIEENVIGEMSNNIAVAIPSTTTETSASLIKEITEATEGGPKSEEATKADEVKDSGQTSKPAPFAASSQIESARDNMDRIEGKVKRITLDQQALSKAEHDMHLDDSQKNIEANVSAETSNKIAMAIPSTTAETSSPLIPSISTPMEPQTATSSSETKAQSSQSDHLDIYTAESAQDENKVNQAETCMPHVSKQLENDDLMILFQIIEEGADMEVRMPCASKITAHEDDSEVTQALANLEALMKMGLEEIASSEESKLRLENALNTLSSHCSDDGLKAIVHSLQQQIQTVLSSFKLEQKQKLMTEQHLQRKGAAMTLLSEIQKTHNSMVEAQTREAELKEQISKLQAELNSKENEIKECEIKLLSLQEQKKKSVSDTIGFIKELEAVKKERCQQENLGSKWSSCLANLKKTSLLLGVHFNQKL